MGILNLMTPMERDDFNCDTATIGDWKGFLLNYARGTGVWAIGEDHISPEHVSLEQILI